jgi:hypothetical protein
MFCQRLGCRGSLGPTSCAVSDLGEAPWSQRAVLSETRPPPASCSVCDLGASELCRQRLAWASFLPASCGVSELGGAPWGTELRCQRLGRGPRSQRDVLSATWAGPLGASLLCCQRLGRGFGASKLRCQRLGRGSLGPRSCAVRDLGGAPSLQGACSVSDLGGAPWCQRAVLSATWAGLLRDPTSCAGASELAVSNLGAASWGQRDEVSGIGRVSLEPASCAVSDFGGAPCAPASRTVMPETWVGVFGASELCCQRQRLVRGSFGPGSCAVSDLGGAPANCSVSDLGGAPWGQRAHLGGARRGELCCQRLGRGSFEPANCSVSDLGGAPFCQQAVMSATWAGLFGASELCCQ